MTYNVEWNFPEASIACLTFSIEREMDLLKFGKLVDNLVTKLN